MAPTFRSILKLSSSIVWLVSSYSSVAFAHSSNFDSYEECVINSLSGTNNTKAVEFIEKACAAKFSRELEVLTQKHEADLKTIQKRLEDTELKYRAIIENLTQEHEEKIQIEREKINNLGQLIDALKDKLSETENWLDRLPDGAKEAGDTPRKLEEVPQLELTADQMAEVKAAIAGCWTLPNTHFEKNLSVDVKVFVNPNGEVVRAQVIDHVEYNTNTKFRIISNAALRALKSCSPIPLKGNAETPIRQLVVTFMP